MEFLETVDLGQLFSNSLHSLQRVFIGLAAATFLGITLGILRSSLPTSVKKNPLIRFLIDAPKFPPPIAWIPFVILGFGIGEVSAYIIVFIGAFAPIFISSFEGAESTPQIWRQTAQSLQIPRVRYFYEIVFKGALPQIFVGLRSGVSMAWMAVIAAEMISGQSGLGYSIQLNRLNLQYDQMIIDMVMISLIGFLLFELILWTEKIVIPWHKKGGRS